MALSQRTKKYLAVFVAVLVLMFFLLVLVTPMVTVAMAEQIHDGYIDPQMVNFVETMNCIYIALTGLLVIGAVFGGVELQNYMQENDIKASDMSLLLRGNFEMGIA